MIGRSILLALAAAPMTYRVKDFDDDYQLRQMVFETCLLPEGWKAWYQAAQSSGK